MAEERNGLILVTGATGSGKSTSLAALLDLINERKVVHVVTLEDPVEFVHPAKRATFNQRELGMQTFDTHLLRLCQEGVITEETALSYASKRSMVARGLDQHRAKRGEKTSDIEGLTLDADYGKPRRSDSWPPGPAAPPAQ